VLAVAAIALAASVLVGLTTDGIALGSQEPIERGINGRPLRLHDRPVKRADIVQVDVHGQYVAPGRNDIVEDYPEDTNNGNSFSGNS